MKKPTRDANAGWIDSERIAFVGHGGERFDLLTLSSFDTEVEPMRECSRPLPWIMGLSYQYGAGIEGTPTVNMYQAMNESVNTIAETNI